MTEIADVAVDIADLALRTRSLCASTCCPVDDEFDGDIAAAGGDELRRGLQAAARQAALLSPHAPVDCGGMGLNLSQRATVFEEAGYSLFGPVALNISAPDEGNVHLLALVASPAQRDQFLRPLVLGQSRSAFAMTEPSPGAGSEPVSTAQPRGEG